MAAMTGILRHIMAVLVVLAGSCAARADSATVAVASNFLPTAQKLAMAFRGVAGDDIRLASGSTGKLFAQIGAGAPFDLFLAADMETPARLGAGAPVVYARGKLVLWSANHGLLAGDGAAVLGAGNLRNLAIADPDLAPYGRAARQVMIRLEVWDKWQPRLVLGENIGQAVTFVATGNAAAGLVAASLVQGRGGSLWLVPKELYDPIEQGAVLTPRGTDNPAAARFLDFILSPEGQDMIVADGYVGPDG